MKKQRAQLDTLHIPVELDALHIPVEQHQDAMIAWWEKQRRLHPIPPAQPLAQYRADKLAELRATNPSFIGNKI